MAEIDQPQPGSPKWQDQSNQASEQPDVSRALKSSNLGLRTYEGGCHCGGVRFRVMADPDRDEISDCNCSMCRKKGFLHLIVPPNQFTLLSGEEMLSTYRFNTGIAKHLFCRICGIHPFYRPRSHPDMIDVNLRCLDQPVLSEFRIVPFDGVNWEANIEQLTGDG